MLDTDMCSYIIKEHPESVRQRFQALAMEQLCVSVITHAELEGAGTPIGAMDMMIAAHAKSIKAVLVTNNQHHFTKVKGLSTDNWT